MNKDKIQILVMGTRKRKDAQERGQIKRQERKTNHARTLLEPDSDSFVMGS